MLSINRVDTKGEWMVGDHHLYIPKTGIKVEHENVVGDSSGRSEDGVMGIDWVRRDVHKVYMQWPVMTESELNDLVSWMQGQEFDFTFKDRGEIKTIHGYCSNCSYTFYTDNYLGTGVSVYTDVSFNVIEL